MKMSIDLEIMTFNLRYANNHDGINSWEFRRQHVFDIINRMKPAVMGIQEGLHNQLNDLHANMRGDYQRFGEPREKGGEHVQIFWDNAIFEKLGGGNFWLSPTPDRPGKKGWDAACVRMTTYVTLRMRKNDKVVHVFNTQLDHEGKLSRIRATELLHERMRSIRNSPEEPIILMGDFNTYHDSCVYQYLTGPNGANMTDSWKVAEKNTGGDVSYTYHSWIGARFRAHGRNSEPGANHIDWILFDSPSSLRVKQSQVITETRDVDGRLFPSDHFPVTSLISFPVE